jgi:outer membrane protein assembly factor BamB
MRMKKASRPCGVLVFIVAALSAVGAWAQDWPQWRGPNRDAKVVGFTAPKTWPKELKEKWSVPVGEGPSSPVLAAGKLYVFGRQGGDEVTTCLDADSGQMVWQDKNPTSNIKGPATGKKGEFKGTRSTPAVADGKVCTLGSSGTVSCLDAATGKVLWREDTKGKPRFYTSSSPLIVDGKCVAYTDNLTAFDMANGSVQWKWTGDDPPYGSPVLMTLAGVKQVVTPTQGAVAGVSLADGKLLWKFKYAGTAYQSTYATPIIDGQMVIYGSPSGKGPAGTTVAYKIEKKGDAFDAAELWTAKLVSYQYNTPVLRDGMLFGLSGDKDKIFFFCMDAKTGKELWKDSTPRGEAGGVVDAGSVLLALTGNSELVTFEPSGTGYKEVAKYKVSETPGYAYPIVSGNRIYVKGATMLTLWTIN